MKFSSSACPAPKDLYSMPNGGIKNWESTKKKNVVYGFENCAHGSSLSVDISVLRSCWLLAELCHSLYTHYAHIVVVAVTFARIACVCVCVCAILIASFVHIISLPGTRHQTELFVFVGYQRAATTTVCSVAGCGLIAHVDTLMCVRCACGPG